MVRKPVRRGKTKDSVRNRKGNENEKLVQYETVAPGVKVLRLWEVVKGEPRWPEHAILRVSYAVHKEFHMDPSAFVNKHKIFSKPVPSRSNLSQIRG